QAVSKHMMERRKGKIISTGSTASPPGVPRQAPFCPAQHGIARVSQTLASEMAEYDVNVNVVCPGGIDTPMVEGLLAGRGAEFLEKLPETTGPYNLFNPGRCSTPRRFSNRWMGSPPPAP